MSRITECVGCERERPYYARGLCASCYNNKYQNRKYRVCRQCREMKRHSGRGLCSRCWSIHKRNGLLDKPGSFAAHDWFDPTPLLELIETSGVELERRHQQVLSRARRAGRMSAIVADRLAIEILKLHPVLIWPDYLDLAS